MIKKLIASTLNIKQSALSWGSVSQSMFVDHYYCCDFDPNGLPNYAKHSKYRFRCLFDKFVSIKSLIVPMCLVINVV